MSLVGRCMIKLLHNSVVSSLKYWHLVKRVSPAFAVRDFSLTSCRLCEESDGTPEKYVEEGKKGHRIPEISYQESIKYMNSEAFKLIYGKDMVWRHYRRNFKGHYYPRPRASCSFGGKLQTASPCPLCRDDYLVVHHQNTALLNQFVSELTGSVLNPKMTGVCMKQHKHLVLAVAQAKDFGLMEKNFHFRKYDYVYFAKLAGDRRKAMLETEVNREPSDNSSQVDTTLDSQGKTTTTQRTRDITTGELNTNNRLTQTKVLSDIQKE